MIIYSLGSQKQGSRPISGIGCFRGRKRHRLRMRVCARALAAGRKRRRVVSLPKQQSQALDVIIFETGTEVKAGKYFTAREWAFFRRDVTTTTTYNWILHRPLVCLELANKHAPAGWLVGRLLPTTYSQAVPCTQLQALKTTAPSKLGCERVFAARTRWALNCKSV